MSTSPNPRTAPAEAANDITDTVQRGLGAMMALPQKLLQMNLEAAKHGLNVMNRRMKAQAALLNDIGNKGGTADAQRTYFETIANDCAEEMSELAEIAKKNFAAMTGVLTGADFASRTPDGPLTRSS